MGGGDIGRGWPFNLPPPTELILRRIVGLLVFILIWPVTAVHAQQDGRAGLVIVGEDGEAQTTCVALPEGEMSGFDLLNRSGLDVTVDVSGAGTAVCAIEGTGCPANDCFCACPGGSDCTYWSYWLATGDEWQYARAGASQVRVKDGDIQGWTWGAGSLTDATQPPMIAFDEICAETGEPVTVNGDQGTDTERTTGGAGWLVWVLTVLGGLGAAVFWLARRRAG